MRRSSQGFSLLETLVAAFILFASLTTGLMAYQGALIVSGKAKTTVEILSVVPFVRSQISSAIRSSVSAQPLTGEGELGEVAFTWSAVVNRSGEAIDFENRQVADGTVNGIQQKRQVYYLWSVNLSLKQGEISKNFFFKEFSWVTQ